MVGIHHAGRFYEFLPNSGSVGWDVDPWGRWRITARGAEYEACVEAACAAPGTPLRAPTIDDGLTPFCRDSFCGTVRAAGARGWMTRAAEGPAGLQGWLACMCRRAGSGRHAARQPAGGSCRHQGSNRAHPCSLPAHPAPAARRCGYASGPRAAPMAPRWSTAPARARPGRWRWAAAPGSPAGSRRRPWRSRCASCSTCRWTSRRSQSGCRPRCARPACDAAPRCRLAHQSRTWLGRCLPFVER